MSYLEAQLLYRLLLAIERGEFSSEDDLMTPDEIVKARKLLPYFGVGPEVTFRNALQLTRTLEDRCLLLTDEQARALDDGTMPGSQMILGTTMTADDMRLAMKYLKYLEAHLTTGPSTPPPGA